MTHSSNEHRLDSTLPQRNPGQTELLFSSIRLWIIVGIALLGGISLGFWFQASQTPIGSSPEVGFARAMAFHHAQAVEMGQLLYDRTDDDEMRILALDMLLVQQYQIGEMGAWVSLWGPPTSENEAGMAWMGMPADAPMPGMATPEELNRLRTLKGVETDALFMQLMIPHHRSGVEMAEAILALSEQPQVRRLAEGIVTSQESEIAYMQDLLQQKGFPPVRDAPGSMPNMP